MSTQDFSPQPESMESLEVKEKALGQELGRDYYLTRIAHDASALDLSRRQAMMAESLAKQTQEVLLGKPSEAAEGDDMGVNVGNTITNHYHPPMIPQPTATPAAPAPASPAPVEATPTEPTSAWKTWLARTAIAAGGLAAGAGGLAGYNWLTGPDEKPPAVEQPANTPQASPYTPPTIIGPGVSTEKWDHLPGDE